MRPTSLTFINIIVSRSGTPRRIERGVLIEPGPMFANVIVVTGIELSKRLMRDRDVLLFLFIY